MENIGHMGSPSAIVESVAVAPDAQGMGVGKALMAHALAIAAANNCYKLALSSNIRRTSAHAFYDRLGFQRHGVSFVVPLTGKAGA
jgi:GNAT superfamily N-acetyltransferase